jgi:4-hydroxy-tetrahydrodipicolinate synthase
MDISGVIPPLVTPVEDRSGTIAVEELKRLTESLVDAGVDGLFPCGTTGEFPSLSREAREMVIEVVVDVADSVPVLAGCGGTNRDEVTEYIEHAAGAGADAVVVVTPYYLPGSQDGLRDFYTDIADVSPLPVVMYHIPARTGQELDAATVQELAKHESIVGIKESTGDTHYVQELLRSTPDSFAVMQGGVIDAPTTLRMGLDGVVPGQANYMPETVVEMYDAYRSGDDEAMTRALGQVNEVSRSFRKMPLVPAIKYLTKYSGFDVGPPLPPLAELDDQQKASLCIKFEKVSQ